jgi:hypothetical protein
VQSQQQSERETCGVIVFGKNGREILVRNTEGAYLLPTVEIPRWKRVAENLTAAVRREWGCDAVCLFSPNTSSQDGNSQEHRYEVMQCGQDAKCSIETAWLPIHSISATSFLRMEQFRAVEQCLAELDTYEGDRSKPFARRGWLGELREWIGCVIGPLGLELTGPSHHYNASPTFNLIQFETTGPAIWFKAVGEPNLHEFMITTTMARLLPRHLPPVLASHTAWHGWLMSDGGTPLWNGLSSVAESAEVAESLASLQIESLDHSTELLAAGARDLSIAELLKLVDPFVEVIVELMRRQDKVPPAPLTRREILDVAAALKRGLNALDTCSLPICLGHTDLNLGNILATATDHVFVDWAEAYVGQPFFTFEYLLSQLKKNWADIAPFENIIRTAYARRWKYFVPAQSISEAFVFSPLTAVFAYAVTCDWRSCQESQDPQLQAYLRGLTRRMKREMDTLFLGSR